MSLAPNMNSTDLVQEQPQFFLPSFEFIDPAKEAAATKTMFDMNAISLSEIIRKDNRNPDETFRLLAEDAKKIQDFQSAYGVEPPAPDTGNNGNS